DVGAVDEGDVGAEDDDEVDYGAGQQVGNAAAEREALADQAAHDRDDAALAHGEDEAEHAAHGDGQRPAARQEARDQPLGQELLKHARDDRPEDDERQRLVEDAEDVADVLVNLQR